jgi:hypothetical protein
MKIEKKKVSSKASLSTAAKTAIASTLGMAATLSLSACLGEAESGAPMGPEQEPTCGEAACDPQSSSSSVLDIPKSQERLSSSALDALSSAAKLSSSSHELPISAGIPHSSPSAVSPSSSSATPLSSSIEEPIALSGDIAPFEDPVSSSSEANSSSSRPEVKIITIEPDPDTAEHKYDIDVIRCDGTDSTSYDVRLCKDPHGFTILSMVTTFEQDDVQT